MSKIDELRQWIKDEICPHGDYEKYVQERDYEGSPEAHKIRVRFFTQSHKYTIVAKDREGDDGYLGCVLDCRSIRAGEDHTRGSDLPDGPFTRATWESIKNAILKRELVLLEICPPLEPGSTLEEAVECKF